MSAEREKLPPKSIKVYLNKEIKHHEREIETENQMKNFMDDCDVPNITKDVVVTMENTMKHDVETESEDVTFIQTNNLKCEQCNYTSQYSHNIQTLMDMESDYV